MIRRLLQQEVQQFIKIHEHDDLDALALKYRYVNDIDIRIVLDQVRGRQKARGKLPGWYRCPGILYPPKISMEQCSSEKTARYKAGLVSGEILMDLTGGFGVDTYYLSQSFAVTHYVEQDEWLYELARHNHKTLQSKIFHHRSDALDFVANFDKKVGVAYLDPARRDAANKKVYRLEDCEPKVVQYLPQLLEKANQLLIKTSPLLDIDLTLQALQFVSSVHVISVSNEVKEVLYLVEKGAPSPRITAINFVDGKPPQAFEFTREEEKLSNIDFGPAGRYLYEPNAALMKAGAFRVIATRYDLKKIHPNTHLYTQDQLFPGFPGRKFEIEQVLPVDKKKVQPYLDNMKANVTTRNFPLSVDALKKKLGIKDGGDTYLFGITGTNGAKRILLTRKVT